MALAPPTFQAALWMVLLLIPLAAFFSAICLALAVLARSMKEGQYYMTPLYLVSLPLVFLTLMPGVELDLFYSLVPITGVALLLKALDPGPLRPRLRVLPAGHGADPGLRGRRAALGDRPVPARGRAVPRGRTIQPFLLAAAPLSRSRADADQWPGDLVLRPDPVFLVVPDAIPGVSRRPPDSGQRGCRTIIHPDPAAVHGDPADLRPGADPPDRLAEAPLSLPGLTPPDHAQPAGQRASADRRATLSHLLHDQGGTRSVSGSSAEA